MHTGQKTGYFVVGPIRCSVATESLLLVEMWYLVVGMIQEAYLYRFRLTRN